MVNPLRTPPLVSKHFRKGFRKICTGLLRRAPRRASGRVCIAAPGTRGSSVLERESTDLTHVSEAAGTSAPVLATLSSPALSLVPGASWRDQNAPSGIPTVNAT